MKKLLQKIRLRFQLAKINFLGFCKRQIIKKKIQKRTLPKLNAMSTSPRYIVTLTSYGKRVCNMVHYAISSIILQTIKPDKIVLYLDCKNCLRIICQTT